MHNTTTKRLCVVTPEQIEGIYHYIGLDRYYNIIKSILTTAYNKENSEKC